MCLKKPCGRFSTNILADFRPRLWPIFGQSFGQISAKVLVRFRPKPWPISDQKKMKLDSAHGPWRASIRRDAGVRNFFREAFPIFTGSFPKFAREAFHFLPKTKIRIQKRSRFLVEKRPKKFDAEEPRLRARSHSVPLWSVFGHDFLVSFRPRFWPPNLKPKSTNALTEIGKRSGRNPKTAIRIFRKC